MMSESDLTLEEQEQIKNRRITTADGTTHTTENDYRRDVVQIGFFRVCFVFVLGTVIDATSFFPPPDRDTSSNTTMTI